MGKQLYEWGWELGGNFWKGLFLEYAQKSLRKGIMSFSSLYFHHMSLLMMLHGKMNEWTTLGVLRLFEIDGTSGPFLSSFCHLMFSLSWFTGVLLMLSTLDWICYLAHTWNSEIEGFLWGNWNKGLKTREGKECSCVFRRGECLKWK